MREALERASRTQQELDKRVFHLKTLYETTCELSGLTQPIKIMEVFLLTALGIFGITRGFACLINTRTREGYMTHRGFTGPEAEACERNLSRMAARYLSGCDPFPQCSQAEVVSCGSAPDTGLLPDGMALLVKQVVDDTYGILAAFGGRLSKEPIEGADLTTLLNLAGAMANALAQNLFNRQIQHLHADLARQSAELQKAVLQAGQARENLDRQIFHLHTLYEFTSELSPMVATEQLVETFLLMTMGTFGMGQGIVLLCDRENRRVRSSSRGIENPKQWSIEEAETCLYHAFQSAENRSLAPMSASTVTGPIRVLPASEIGLAVNTALLLTVDASLLGLIALGSPLAKSGLAAEEYELLKGLAAGWMVFLKNARAFETIQALNADLRRTNADLRQTITDLTEARRQIRLLELAKTRLKQLVQREVERVGRFRPVDVLLMMVIASLLALSFNYSSPNGIPLGWEDIFERPAPAVDVISAQQMVSKGEAVLVDARPPELFKLKHIAAAINLPVPLFDILYPMKLGRNLKPEQVVLVYGRTVSKRYDDDLAQRLLQRHEHVRILEGGLAAWEGEGFQVAP